MAYGLKSGAGQPEARARLRQRHAGRSQERTGFRPPRIELGIRAAPARRRAGKSPKSERRTTADRRRVADEQMFEHEYLPRLAMGYLRATAPWL